MIPQDRDKIISLIAVVLIISLVAFGFLALIVGVPTEGLILLAMAGLFFVFMASYRDPITMPMKLKAKVITPSAFDKFLMRLKWLRTPWSLSPTATEVVISRALAEPRLAHSIEAALLLALRHKHKRTRKGWSDIWDAMKQLPAKRGPNELVSLNWILTGKPEDIFWSIDGKRLDVCAKWPNGIEIGSNGIGIPNDLIPMSVRTSLAGRRFGDLFDLPFVRPDRIIEERDIKNTTKGVVLDIFRDERTIGDIGQVLNVIGYTKKMPGLTVTVK